MSEQQKRDPQFILTQFTEKTDRNGNLYFVGTLGMLSVKMFKDRKSEGRWNIFVQQKPREEKKEVNEFDQRNEFF